jgi:hypothetical protein
MDEQKPNENNTGLTGEPQPPKPLPTHRKSRKKGPEMDLPDGIDQRTKAARRWRYLFSAYLNAHHPVGGPNIAHRSAAKNAATTEILLDSMNSDLLNGRPVDAALLARLQRRMDRYLYDLGISKILPEEDEKTNPAEALARLKDPSNWKKDDRQ